VWRPSGVSTIITDPPYNDIALYRALADFAVEVLPDGGAVISLCSGPILADVVQAMAKPELIWRTPLAWLYGTADSRTYDRPRRVFDTWKPVVVYHKRGWADDVPVFSDRLVSNGLPAARHHRWEQNVEATITLVRYFSAPGDLVCDPFLGSGTTGVAALAEARHFIGADIDVHAVRIARRRLAA
jgi:site-specific DNA-methyltransferase (adenine-specific)